MPDVRRARFKILLLGEAAVGKTSLIRRYVHGSFSEAYLATLGTTVSKRLEVVPQPPGPPVEVNLVVWDIMGNRRIMDLLGDAFFVGASGAIAVFDITRRETFQYLGSWIETARNERPDMPILVLGNKSDLEAQREVLDEDAGAYCEAMGLAFLPASAKTGLNVEEAFRHTAQRVVQLYASLPPASRT